MSRAITGSAAPSLDVELTRDRVRAVGGTPQHDERAHPDVEAGQINIRTRLA